MRYLTPPEQVTIRALQAIHAATHPAAANEPRSQPDGAEAKRIAVSELLAALDEEAADEPVPLENRIRLVTCGSSGIRRRAHIR